jgi:hypothetical protein
VTLNINVLTGRRPDLLQRTLDSFTVNHPDVWESAVRTVLHNGGDPQTAAILDRHTWHDRHVTDRLLPIGEATTLLTARSAAHGTDLMLRLEDDWEAEPGGWWDDAVTLLDGGAAQVRLRKASEPVSARCMVCRQPGHLHFTFNPTLTYTKTWTSLLPIVNERDAMRKFHRQPAAQLQPGVFAHIGGDDSLRTNGGKP